MATSINACTHQLISTESVEWRERHDTLLRLASSFLFFICTAQPLTAEHFHKQQKQLENFVQIQKCFHFICTPFARWFVSQLPISNSAANHIKTAFDLLNK